MIWQECPVCKGVGNVGIGFPMGNPCSVCLGQKIISTLTGLPPRRITQTTSNSIYIRQEDQEKD